MKRFDNFGEYMFQLLFAPLKKSRRNANQLFIFFRIIGREFDDLKKMLFRLREECNVASASPVMLSVHGQDRDLPRLAGEDDEAYRTRLMMKGVVASWGGTKKGIVYELASMGYDLSYIEPVSYEDPERWAEFRVYLGSSGSSSVTDLKLVSAQVNKVKEASSLAEYGIEDRNRVEIRSWNRQGQYAHQRICGRFRCGQRIETEVSE